ncbi:regulatory protein RecX [Humibacter sp. RRB41]|uniref:regulatory protein RecX n=1 Tax=Humibacter sp. RRB41 TaxID=2919946 RepID=UPI001FA9EEE5|nr:regulatory protein RecX [Humibacter sp. RRB41]
MVVQFPPAGDSERPKRRRPPGAMTSGGRSGDLAPVTYLPGAQPSAAAQHALERVNAVSRRDDGDGDHEADGRGRGGRDRKTTRANNVAIHQLARRGMSRWELEQVLAKREVDDETAAAELDRLESIGLVDDAALAVSMVYAMHTRKGSGRSAIESELRRRHLDDDVIADAMAELDGDDEKERATELAVARARQLTSLDYDVASRRLSGFLLRKGYDGETVRAAVRTALESHPRGPSTDGGRVRFR